jgi:hypothetical protein
VQTRSIRSRNNRTAALLSKHPTEAGHIVLNDEHDYCPTPEMIAAECERIRAGWSEREHWQRAGYKNGRKPAWHPPSCRVSAPDNRLPQDGS